MSIRKNDEIRRLFMELGSNTHRQPHSQSSKRKLTKTYLGMPREEESNISKKFSSKFPEGASIPFVGRTAPPILPHFIFNTDKLQSQQIAAEKNKIESPIVKFNHDLEKPSADVYHKPELDKPTAIAEGNEPQFIQLVQVGETFTQIDPQSPPGSPINQIKEKVGIIKYAH